MIRIIANVGFRDHTKTLSFKLKLLTVYDINRHGWKKYFSFWDCGSKTLKFSASFALFQVEYVVI